MSNSESPSSPPRPRPLNAGTLCPTDLWRWEHDVRARALRVEDAYALAVAADRVRAPQSRPGYRLYWMRHGFFASHDVSATAEGYAVVGRHSACDIVIDDERAVSLRHVLVRCGATDDGAPILNVLDLRSGTGFELSDGTKPHSISATGPIAFRVGAHVMVALPGQTRLPAELPAPVVDREECRGERERDKPHAVRMQRPIDDGPPPSRITLMAPSVDLSTRRSTWSDAPRFVPPPAGERWAYELDLELPFGGGRRAVVLLTERDLDHGVLIGRAEKCLDDGLRAILSEQISRVHALVVRDRGVCLLYDVASTNGTFDDAGHRRRCITLDDEGTTVNLLRANGLVVRFRSLTKLH